MALSRLTYNSLNVTPTASKGIGFDSGADDLSTDFAGGAMTFIKKLTSDGSDDTLSFVDGTSDVVIDSTYKEYMFIFNNMHPETDATEFQFQGNEVSIMLECLCDMDIVINCGQNPFWDGEDIYECCP